MEHGTAPVPPPAEVKKKGLPPLAWAGIGCGAIVIIGAVVVALLVATCTRKVGQWAKDVQKNPEKSAAEMMVRFNPDLELVSQDEGAGEMTIRVKSSGEEVTLSYQDMAAGRITLKDADGQTVQVGKVDTADLPTWVPQYPNIVETNGAGQQKGADQVTGFVMFTTADTPEAVSDFFKEAAGKAGMNNTSSSKMNLGGQESVSLECSGNARKLTVLAAKDADGPHTTVTVHFEGTQ